MEEANHIHYKREINYHVIKMVIFFQHKHVNIFRDESLPVFPGNPGFYF